MRAMNKPSVHDMIARPCTAVFSSSGGVTYEPFPPERGFGILSEMSHPKSYTEVVEDQYVVEGFPQHGLHAVHVVCCKIGWRQLHFS